MTAFTCGCKDVTVLWTGAIGVRAHSKILFAGGPKPLNGDFPN